MEFNDIRKLARAAAHAEKSAPVAFSYEQNGQVENFSEFELNEVLRTEFKKIASDYKSFRRNKVAVFELIEETIDEMLPARVESQYMQFAEVRNMAQGDKAVFRKRITEASRKRAKSFITRVGLAGRYEVFMLDSAEIEVGTAAIGGAARIGLEEFLDGYYTFADFTELLMEGMDEYIYKEIAKALAATVAALPAPNQAIMAGFDETTMDELLAIADSYGHSAIFCTYEFAATIRPDQAWASSAIKDEMWRNGAPTNYKGHSIVILPQSLEDETNMMKVIDPSVAYIIPAGADKPVKLVFEGATQVRTVEDNDDWSTDMQVYKKFGIATLANHYMCVYKNTDLKMETRSGVVGA